MNLNAVNLSTVNLSTVNQNTVNTADIALSNLSWAQALPVIFVALMGLAILIYAILDGYDLGVGILLPLNDNKASDRDTMIASIGPFWDANETWLVLAVGLMLIAFPAAHSLVLYHLYLPCTLMLIGLIMRGVAFDFRAKAAVGLKTTWDLTFKVGSILTTLSQGYMLGQYVLGFDLSLTGQLFSLLSAVCVSAAYCYIGAAWLIMKTTDDLQKKAIKWTRYSGWAALLGISSVSIVNPLVNPDVYQRWFSSDFFYLAFIIPVLCFTAFFVNDRILVALPKEHDKHCWLPFVGVSFIFLLSFIALGFSFFPYVVPGKMDIWQAASAPESLQFIFIGAVIVIPVILIYTIFSYRVFHGKAQSLQYY